MENSDLAAFRTETFCGFGEIYHMFSNESLNSALQTSLLKPSWHRSHLQAQEKPQQHFSHREIPSHMTAHSSPGPFPAAELSLHPWQMCSVTFFGLFTWGLAFARMHGCFHGCISLPSRGRAASGKYYMQLLLILTKLRLKSTETCDQKTLLLVRELSPLSTA